MGNGQNGMLSKLSLNEFIFDAAADFLDCVFIIHHLSD
jgi:hypothetical protein